MEIFDSWLVNQAIAHRGLHDKKAPENSLAAFEKAIKKGYAIELDVQLLSDGTPVVFHDEQLQRMTNQDGYISQLKQEDLPNYKLQKTNQTIPSLQQVLDFVAGQTPLLIEIKNSGKVGQLESQVLKLLKNYNGEYAIQSFNPFTLAYFHDNAPEILRGQLSGSFADADISRLKKSFLRRMVFNKKVSRPNFIAYQAELLPNRFVRKYKHLPLLAWCVRTQEEYLHVVKYCDNVIFENFEPKI
jgi:glycerophosphoryl diester phosphodiesterase